MKSSGAALAKGLNAGCLAGNRIGSFFLGIISSREDDDDKFGKDVALTFSLTSVTSELIEVLTMVVTFVVGGVEASSFVYEVSDGGSRIISNFTLSSSSSEARASSLSSKRVDIKFGCGRKAKTPSL